MNSTLLQNQRVRIGLFMLIAVGFSYYFRIDPPNWYQSWDLPVSLSPFKNLLGALGIFLGATIVERLHPTPERITLTGTSWRNSVLMISLPITVFVIIGVPNSQIEPHVFGLIIGLQAALWAFLEEYGWRKYLHNELSNYKPQRRYIIVGVLWYLWHLWFLRHNALADPTSFILNTSIGFVIIMGASWGLGAVVERTKSLLVGVCFHMLGSFIQFNPIITENVSNNTRWLIFGLCLVFWIVILTRWIKSEKKQQVLSGT